MSIGFSHHWEYTYGISCIRLHVKCTLGACQAHVRHVLHCQHPACTIYAHLCVILACEHKEILFPYDHIKAGFVLCCWFEGEVFVGKIPFHYEMHHGNFHSHELIEEGSDCLFSKFFC